MNMDCISEKQYGHLCTETIECMTLYAECLTSDNGLICDCPASKYFNIITQTCDDSKLLVRFYVLSSLSFIYLCLMTI